MGVEFSLLNFLVMSHEKWFFYFHLLALFSDVLRKVRFHPNFSNIDLGFDESSSFTWTQKTISSLAIGSKPITEFTNPFIFGKFVEAYAFLVHWYVTKITKNYLVEISFFRAVANLALKVIGTHQLVFALLQLPNRLLVLVFALLSENLTKLIFYF